MASKGQRPLPGSQGFHFPRTRVAAISADLIVSVLGARIVSRDRLGSWDKAFSLLVCGGFNRQSFIG